MRARICILAGSECKKCEVIRRVGFGVKAMCLQMEGERECDRVMQNVLSVAHVQIDGQRDRERERDCVFEGKMAIRLTCAVD